MQLLRLKIHDKVDIAVFLYVYVKVGVSQQYNIYLKTAIFLWKSSTIIVLGLAVAPATWYNKIISQKGVIPHVYLTYRKFR